ncbi:uncharacterized protein LOC128733602 [Sabethes cyaneus]|uniref:uncharacterized protein LOC128733602 n=1 Tax=Sabethes cyaneus TaxID=53552 RepID=UPI00237E25EA|nr:uncharacterized protein LOC128733602 [Sabethes cyaneus]XP_053683291.1 uncharacterized protein LOC128733602 [Sabethes cyaneus]XP_053683292.1 uncharacterized protein LOC128733602 [Sabethes cyaneus]XP_053683293.1 uncharacterized protein LOC128733602 [Sabethes cyaneus]XP_053683295.1 uncharacterized protein LOC128733602 [Sabethes cyaneus]
MADDEEDKESRYEKLWHRVKVYIPFLQELISLHKNDTTQNRQQHLQKITTMYDLLTNKRLNYSSLCRCEAVLIKLYNTNTMKKKNGPDSSSVEPPSSAIPDAIPSTSKDLSGFNTANKESSVSPTTSPTESAMPELEPETPASPCERYNQDEPEPEEWDDTHSFNAQPVRQSSKPPLSLDEIQRLITEKPGPSNVRPESGNNLSKAINDTLKILSKDFRKVTPEGAYHTDRYRNWSAPTYASHVSHQSGMHRSPQFGNDFWDTENDSYGSFPHPVHHPHVSRNYNMEPTLRPPKSPPLYRRRDNLPIEDIRYPNDRMEISPSYSSPSEVRSPPVAVPPMNIKDPRLRRATVSNNDPRLNRANIPPQATITSVPNELPKCIAPNPNLPLDLPKKDPPKRRLSICANQVIIEEIPPEPGAPRRLSMCGEFQGVPFVQPPPSVQPMLNNYDDTFHGAKFQNAVPVHPVAPLFPPPSHPLPLVVPSQSIEAPSIAERDPRRKHLPPGAEYMKTPYNPVSSARPPNGPKKGPLTYLEYRRQKEMHEKQMREKQMRENLGGGKAPYGNKEKFNNGKNNYTDTDLTIGMVPNKTRVAAKAYAKPAKSRDQSFKERQFAPPGKERPRQDVDNKKRADPKSHKSDFSTRGDKKGNSVEKEKKSSSTAKTKDLFGEQLSQFDKMYRSGDFTKKASAPAGIGGFKIPKIKQNEKPAPADTTTTDRNDHRSSKSVSKSAEPVKNSTFNDDDDVWDAEETESVKKISKVEKGTPQEKSNAGDNTEQKNQCKVSSESNKVAKTLEDEDLWDDDTLVPSKATYSTKNIQNTEASDDKPNNDGFQVPKLPAPKRIARRRNSIAAHDPKPDIPVSQPVEVSTRIIRRRNSIAVSQVAQDNEQIDDYHVLHDSDEKVKDQEEDIIRPRKPRKRRIIDDEDEEEKDVEISGSARLSTSSEKESNSDVPIVNKKTIKDRGAEKSIVLAADENIVSSTTTESKVTKATKQAKKRKQGKKATASKEDKNKLIVPAVDDTSPTSKASSSPATADLVKIDDSKIDTNQQDMEEKKAKEDTETVENMIRSTTNPDTKAQLLEILSKILDEKKLKKVQEIIESPSDKSLISGEPEAQVPNDQSSENLQNTEDCQKQTPSASVSSSNQICNKALKRKLPKRTELDKLNADIAEMYIRDGVLSATGRRSCTKKPQPVEKKRKLTRKATGKSKVSHVEELKENVASTPAELVNPYANLKPFNIVLKKLDISQIDFIIERKGKQTVESLAETVDGDEAQSTASISPKSRKKKRTGWATGIVPKKKKKLELTSAPAPSSPVKSYTPKPVTKNTNRELHCQNATKSKECALCSYTGALSTMVQHYVRSHPLHEVYVSRIPNPVATKLKKEPSVITGTIHDQTITYKCIFCQEVLSKKKYNWKLHLASHTGEYRYKCNNCTIKSLTPSTNAHDVHCTGPAMEVINEFMFEGNHIYGYICRLCNFIQLSRSNLITHLKEEHDRHFTSHGILRFSILNYEPEDLNELDQSISNESVSTDISMPELVPQVPVGGQTSLSAFISSAPDDIDPLSVLNDPSFMSPSKPSIIDKLRANLDEIMRNEQEEKSRLAANTISSADDDEWEDIDSPPKESILAGAASKETSKARRSLTSPAEDVIPMPAPLALKEEEVDLFDGKQVVANVAYNKIDNKTWYLCLVEGCKHATEMRQHMYSHVQEQHSDVTWDGYCYLCTAQVVQEEVTVLSKEIKHMAMVHIKDHTAVDELLALPSNGSELSLLGDDHHTLKLRRFSGDKLSLGMDTAGKEETINVQPWLEKSPKKNRAHSLNMLEQKSLFCFYKCMGTSCCFTTPNEGSMQQHLENHDLVADVGALASAKSWLECSYCELQFESKTDLLDHLRTVHSRSVYQCAYCFYRSRDAQSVILHQKLHHEKETKKVLFISSEKQSLTAADNEMLNRRRLENILPLICTVCKEEFCGLDAYMTHLKVTHAELTTIACQCCKEIIQKPKLPRHLLVHKIGIYECMYCQFGSNTMEAVQTHVCNSHPQEPFYCCVRYNKTPGKAKEASLKALFENPVDESDLVYCPFSMEELNHKSTDTKSNSDIEPPVKPTIIPLQLPPIRFGDTNILLSAQIPSSTAGQVTQQTVVVSTSGSGVMQIPTISSFSGGIHLSEKSSVPIITAVQGNYHGPLAAPSTVSQSMPIITNVAGGVSATKDLGMPIIARVEGGVAAVNTIKQPSSLVGTKIIISPNKGAGVPIITNVCSIGPSKLQLSTTTEDEKLMLEAERVAMEMIKDTGLPKNVIYKCVFKGCNSVLPDGTGMRKHLSFSHLLSPVYTCIHCKGRPTFTSVMLFTQHLKTHEAQRIFCFMCDYKGSFPPEVIKHVKDVHKTNKPTILFLNPKKNDPNNDIILFAPGQPADLEKKAFYKKLIDLYNHKLQAALLQQKTHFAPEECDSLPKQAIFSQTVFCSNCQYSTKVRLNMYRHLKNHLNDMPVSNVDPKNPVPCWNQGEKHFDRMRNPAASSQEDDDLIQSLCFVQENKRFICGAPNCRHLTTAENMLRNHLSTLHVDTKDYKCPHCPAVHIFSGQLNIVKILEHLKLHDKELYRCSKCSLFLNNKSDMDRHISEKHPNVPNVSTFVIRDGSTAGSVSSVATDDEVVFNWKCDVCKFKTVTLTEMRVHMQITHNIHAKYRCSLCLYSSSNKSQFTGHFEKDHPGSEIVIVSMYKAIEGDDSRADTTPLWRRETNKTKSIRGIMLEPEEDVDEIDPIEENLSVGSEEILRFNLETPGPSGASKRHYTESIDTSLANKRSKPNEDETIVKAFKCGFKGCSYVNDFGSGIVHHFKTSHPNEKPSVLRNALANPQQSRFDYFLKYACFYCVKKADTVQELLQHWRTLHKIAGQDKPFLFRTAKIILCFYCRKGAVMPEMKSHFTTCHPGLQPIYLDFRNPRRCAECDFTIGVNRQDMVIHFAAHHKLENEYAKGWIDYLSDDIIDKVLQLNSVTYGCVKCDYTSENNFEFTTHYGTKHPGHPIEFNEFSITKKIIYYCAFNNCKGEFTNERDLAKHIVQHVPPFECRCDEGRCLAQFRTFTMLLQHFQITHPQLNLQYALKIPEQYKNVLRMVTIQFWNGFVMTMEDARQAGNRYGSHEGFFKLIEEICAESVTAGTRLL